MAAVETPLGMVRRHVAEGESHIARQLGLIERLRVSHAELDEAEALLVQFRSTQAAHLEHLAQIQAEQAAGLRDPDGNLALR
jgi:hypothetical protein